MGSAKGFNRAAKGLVRRWLGVTTATAALAPPMPVDRTARLFSPAAVSELGSFFASGRSVGATFKAPERPKWVDQWMTTARSGAEGGNVRLAMDSVPFEDIQDYALLSSPWSEGLGFMGYGYLCELQQRPEYRRISEIWAAECTRKWVKLKGDSPERIASLEKLMRDFGVREKFREAIEIDGGQGRAHVFMDFGDDNHELPDRLEYTPETVPVGALKNLKVVEPFWCYPLQFGTTNPLADDYYKPSQWIVMSYTVHNSRLLTFVGRELPDILKPVYMFGGLSLSQMAKPYIDNFVKNRTSVSNLLYSFSTMVLSTNMGAMLDADGAQAMIRRMQAYAYGRDNGGLMMVDKETEDLKNVAAPIAGVDKLLAQAQEFISSVVGIPLVVLLGVTPSGLNASSEGELSTFHDHIKGYQEKTLQAPLTALLRVLQLHLDGRIDETLTFEFVNLSEPTELEKSQLRQANMTTATGYITAGVLDPEDERTRLENEEGGLWFGVKLKEPTPPQDYGGPDDEPSADEEGPAGANDAWSEGDHPRGEGGQFGSGGRMDHGELNIPGRTNNINRELDRHNSAVAKERHEASKGHQATRREREAKVKEFLADTGHLKAMAKRMGKPLAELKLAIKTAPPALLDRMIAEKAGHANDAAGETQHWITVHPDGPDSKGTPMLITSGGKVVGGAGGKLDGQILHHVNSMSGARNRGNKPERPEGHVEPGHVNSPAAGPEHHKRDDETHHEHAQRLTDRANASGIAQHHVHAEQAHREAREDARANGQYGEAGQHLTTANHHNDMAHEIEYGPEWRTNFARQASANANHLSTTTKPNTNENVHRLVTAHGNAYSAHAKARQHLLDQGVSAYGNDPLMKEHYEGVNHHRDLLTKARKKMESLEKADKKRALTERAAAAAKSDNGPTWAELNERHVGKTHEELDKHFRERWGMGIHNATNAVREYRAWDKSKEAGDRYRSDVPEEVREAARAKNDALRSAARKEHGYRVSKHSDVDLDDGGDAAKTQKQILGHVEAALEHLESQGFNIKSALADAKVHYAPGGTGTAGGHAYPLNGNSYFSLSHGKHSLAHYQTNKDINEQRLAGGHTSWSPINAAAVHHGPQAVAIHELVHAIAQHAGGKDPGNSERALGQLLINALPAGTNKRKWVGDNLGEYALKNLSETDAELGTRVTSRDYVRGTLPKELEDHVDKYFRRKGANA